jgi:hypothetical protein
MNSAQGAGPLLRVRDLLTQRVLMNQMRLTGAEFPRITCDCVTNHTGLKCQMISITHAVGFCLNSAWLQKVIRCLTEKSIAIGWFPSLVVCSWLSIEDLCVKGVAK